MSPQEIEGIYQNHVEKLGKPNSSGWAQGLCPFHDDKKTSFSVHLETGSWKCFGGCGENGKGSIYSFAHLKGIQLNGNRKPDIVKTYDYADEKGEFAYQKYVKDDKSFGWRHRKDGDWVYKLPVKRFPYRVKELMAWPITEPVFIVEGEKCVHTLSDLGVFATTSGAANSWHKDLNPFFKGRNVVVWQDNDQPGNDFAAAVQRNLFNLAASLKIRLVDDGRVGSDAEDWILQGGTKEKLLEEIRALPEVKEEAESVFTTEIAESPVVLWHKFGLVKTAEGIPINNLDNAVKVLERAPLFKDVVWYDEFHRKVLTMFNCKSPRPWTDADYLALTRFFQDKLGMRRINLECVSQAVRLVASRNVRNEPKEWMESLKWDENARVGTFFHDAFGTDGTDYAKTIGENFWISIIARIFSPGCQMDNMVVLEGDQGIGKSRALRTLGGSWYIAVMESVMSKDFFMVLPGSLIVEVAELDSFRKAEISRIKQVVSVPYDSYRIPYGREKETFPRMCVFIGTTNEKEYLKDYTGARRFWPIRCGKINQGYIESDREQFFAEALTLYKKGTEWWKTMPETKIEQEERREIDPWEKPISDFLSYREETTPEEILGHDCLNIEKQYQDSGKRKKVCRILRLFKWDNKPKRGDEGVLGRVWRPVEIVEKKF